MEVIALSKVSWLWGSTRGEKSRRGVLLGMGRHLSPIPRILAQCWKSFRWYMVLGYTLRPARCWAVALILLWLVKKPTMRGSCGEQQSLMGSGVAALTSAIMCETNMWGLGPVNRCAEVFPLSLGPALVPQFQYHPSFGGKDRTHTELLINFGKWGFQVGFGYKLSEGKSLTLSLPNLPTHALSNHIVYHPPSQWIYQSCSYLKQPLRLCRRPSSAPSPPIKDNAPAMLLPVPLIPNPNHSLSRATCCSNSS